MFNLANQSNLTITLIAPILLALYFAPTIACVLLNRKHKKEIFVANIISGISWFAWFGVLLWAVTGKSKVEKSAT